MKEIFYIGLHGYHISNVLKSRQIYINREYEVQQAENTSNNAGSVTSLPMPEAVILRIDRAIDVSVAKIAAKLVVICDSHFADRKSKLPYYSPECVIGVRIPNSNDNAVQCLNYPMILINVPEDDLSSLVLYCFIWAHCHPIWPLLISQS